MMSESDFVLELEGIRKVYRGGVEALAGINLKVPRGCIYGLLGPNGAGKSTLVKILTTLIRRSGGSGTMLGKPIGDRGALQRIGLLPEHARFPDYLTGRQVIMYSAGMSGVNAALANTRADGLLERTGMSAAANDRISTYSKGMKQRIGLAQALVNDPELLILDEPTDGVDPEGRIEIRKLVGEMREEGRTVLVNSHLLGEMEQMADEVAIIARGRVVLTGGVEDLMASEKKFEVCTKGPVPADLRAKLEEKGFSVGGDRIELLAEGLEEVQEVIDLLRAGGCMVRRVAEVTKSLEEVFLQSLGEDAKGGAR